MQPEAITALRLQRQCLDKPADEAAYTALYRDVQPGQTCSGEPL